MPLFPSGFPQIDVRHPKPHDLVRQTIRVCGIATAFEAELVARVRDGNGTQLVDKHFQAGGTGIWGDFQVDVALIAVPSTAQGTLIVFSPSVADEDSAPIARVEIPIVFGSKLINPYNGFAPYGVAAGDTLSKIALEVYGDASQWPRIFDANRDQISNPNVINVGQILRVPQ